MDVYWINQVQSILVFYGYNSTISVYVDSRHGQDDGGIKVGYLGVYRMEDKLDLDALDNSALQNLR